MYKLQMTLHDLLATGGEIDDKVYLRFGINLDEYSKQEISPVIRVVELTRYFAQLNGLDYHEIIIEELQFSGTDNKGSASDLIVWVRPWDDAEDLDKEKYFSIVKDGY